MKVFEDFDLTPYNSYRVGARCARAFFPESEEDVRDFFRDHPTEDKYLLGSGHNVILAREWYDGAFLIFNGNFDRVSVEGTVIEAEAGAFSKTLSQIAYAHALSGLEVFYDIPSSLGGAIVMNAGASGHEIKDVTVSIRYLDLRTLEIVELPATAAGFGYRQSIFQAGSMKVVLAARMELSRCEPTAIRRKMEQIKASRWAKQPRDSPSAGSVFKRPPNRYVGPMIEELGLKGYRIGGAMISEKHAGIFVNADGATGEDIVQLIRYVQDQVKHALGVELEPEQVIFR